MWLLALLLCSAALAEPAEKVRLQLKWFSSFQFAGYYMALEKGYYAESGLDVAILERNPKKDHILQLLDGQADFAIADSAILLWRAQGKPVKILAPIFQHSPLIFISKKNSGILSPFEMKGKSISFQRGTDDAALMAVLNIAKLKDRDYHYVPLDFSMQKFIHGDVDVQSAYLSNEPYALKETGTEVNIINPLNYGIDFYGDNLITTDQEISHHPERVKAFLAASLRGWKYALAHKKETVALLHDKYGAKKTLSQLSDEADQIEKMIIPEMVDIGYTSMERYRRIAETYQALGKIAPQQINEALANLIYTPDDEDVAYLRYLAISIGLLILALLAAIRMGFSSRSLKLAAENNSRILHAIYETTVDGIISIDDHGNIISFNPAATELFGYSAAEVVGQHIKMLMPEPYCSQYATNFTQHLRSGEQRHAGFSHEILGLRKNATTFPMDLALSEVVLNNRRMINGIVRDLTQIKQSETAAKEALNRIEKIASRVPGLVYQFRMRPDGSSCFPFASEAICEIYQVSPEDVRLDASRVFAVLHPEDLDSVAASIQKSAHDLTLWQHEYRVRYADGTVRWLFGNAAPEREADGSTLWHGFISDITERIQIEQLKSEFISTVSHELRTPLTSISGSLGLVMGGVLGVIPEQAAKIITVALRNSQRLTFMINDLLDMEKLEAGKMYFDLQGQQLLPLLEQAVESNSSYGLQRDVQLVIDKNQPDFPVHVDSQRLLQVLSNLLSNAIKYSPDHGSVTIGMQLQGTMVRVSVSDSGPGIPLEFRQRIFQKFSQADSSDTRQKGGTGLGLAITKELIERMQGQIGFTSIEGQGSCFYFDLPIYSTQVPTT